MPEITSEPLKVSFQPAIIAEEKEEEDDIDMNSKEESKEPRTAPIVDAEKLR